MNSRRALGEFAPASFLTAFLLITWITLIGAPLSRAEDPAPTIVTWARNYGSAAPESVTYVEPALDGGFVALGAGSNDLIVMKLSSTGSVLWSQRLGGAGTETGKLVRPTNDGGFVV